jgi:CDP-paratose 2-epimerase
VAVTTSIRDPRADFDANALGTLNVLEAVRIEAGGRPAVLYSSTNKVYGALHHRKTVEEKSRYVLEDRPLGIDEHEPLDLHSPYGCSKGIGDQYVHDYARVYGLRTIVFRQSCIYGTRQFGIEDQGWIAWFCIAALTGRPITIYGNGKQIRDALWVEDLIHLYLLAADRIDAVHGQVFNTGGGPDNTLSILELVDWLERVLDRPLNVSFADSRPADQRVFIADVTKVKNLLGWEPTVSVDEGLNKMLGWVEAHRELFALPTTSMATRQVVSAGKG